MIHRDVKPANVIRSDDGRLWLVDFGAVRDTTTTMAGSSTIVGTYGYMAPEQFRGHAVPGSDIYGVGATLLYLLGGKPPTDYPQEKLKVAFRGHVRVSPFLARWIDRALEPAPEERFSDAGEALAVLRGQKRIDNMTGPRDETKRAKRLGAVLGTLLLIMVVIGAKNWLGDFVAGFAKGYQQARRAQANPPPAPRRRGPPKRLAERPLGPDAARGPRAFEGRHASFVYHVAISPNDKLVASGSDRVIKLWDSESGKELHSIAAHDAKVYGLAFFSDNKRLLSMGGKALKTWDVASGKELSTVDLGGKESTGLTLAPDDKVAFLVGADADVHVIDLEKRVQVATFTAGAPIYSVALNHDATRLAIGLHDGRAKVIALPKGNEVLAWAPHTKVIDSIAFSPDDAFIATASDDGRVAISSYGTRGNVFLDSEYWNADESWSVAFSPDSKLVGVTSKDRTVSFISLTSRYVMQMQSTSVMNPHGVFTHDGRHFIAGTGGQIASWTIAKRGLSTPFPEPRDDAAGEPTPRDDAHRRFLEIMKMARLWPAVSVNDMAAKVGDALAANPTSPLTWIANAQLELRYAYRGGADYDQKHVDLARKHLAHAESLGPKGSEFWSVKAWTERAAKNIPAAREAIRQAYAKDPREPYTVLCEARLNEKEERFADVVASLGDLVRGTRRPDILAWAYQQLASAFEELGDLDAADRAYQGSVNANPTSAFGHGNYASFLVQAGDVEKGMSEAKAALAISDYGAARATLARAHQFLGNRLLWEEQDAEDRALAAYEQAIGIDADSAAAYYGRAAVTRARAFDKKDRKLLDSARTDLNKALRLYPDWGQPRAALAELDELEASWK